MNNKLLPLGVFILLLSSSLFAGHRSFQEAQNRISNDLSRALALTMQEKRNHFITRDTIQACKQIQSASEERVFLTIVDEKFRTYLQNEPLKDKAYISFGLFNQSEPAAMVVENAICSDTLFFKDQELGETLTLKGYIEPDIATVFKLSDQKASTIFVLAAFLWAIFSLSYFRKKKEELSEIVSLGGMTYSEQEDCFYDAGKNPIHFTPMQQHLILLFWNAPSHTLPKEDICAALWPKKEDANDTLYTLVRRIKPIIEKHTHLQITVDRGKSYSLEIKQIESGQTNVR